MSDAKDQLKEPDDEKCKEDDGDGDRDGDGDPSRGHWENPLDFFISCLGYAVGLGNVWRFPLLCFRHGGGSFLIPYVLMLFGAGLPLFFLEISLGQYAGVGPIKIFGRLAPILKGLGHAVVCVGILLSFFYNVVVSWSIWYFFASITSIPLDWGTCDHDYNTERCYSKWQEMDCQNPESKNSSEILSYFYNNTCVSAESICNEFNLKTVEKDSRMSCTNGSFEMLPEFLLQRSSSVEEYWQRNVLGDTEEFNWNNFGTPRLNSVLALFCAWFLVSACLLKGVKTSGKVVYVTSLFPYCLLLVIAIRGFTLPGASEGILAYLTPQWDRLLTLDLWVDAATQIIFSLGPACGCVITLSSYNQINRNCHRDAIFIAIANSLTSIFCGFVVFSILGFMAHDSQVEVMDVVKGGPGLAFIVYPEVMTRMEGFPNLFAALFFLMLVTLALGSIFGAFETVISAVCDQFPQLRTSKPQLVISLSLVAFLLGLPFTCPGGIHMFTLFNAAAPSWNLLLFALLEVVVVGWFYGAEKFIDNITSEMGINMSRFTKMYWIISWKFMTPGVLSILLVMAWANFGHVTYEDGYVYPILIQILGYFITGCTLIWIPVFAIIEARKKSQDNEGTTMSLIQPTSEWGRQVNTTHSYGSCQIE